MSPSFDSYWDIREDRAVKIASRRGQALFALSDSTYMAESRPEEWLLLCRFANTIRETDGDREVRQIYQLMKFFKDHAFESLHGYAYPYAAQEIEREIVSREAPEDLPEIGRDLTPAMRLLRQYEPKSPAFTQPERNLLLRFAFYVGDYQRLTEMAEKMAAHDFSEREIIGTCREIEAKMLDGFGLSTMDGIEQMRIDPPTFRFDFRNCESYEKFYNPYTYFPKTELLPDNKLLLNGDVLRPGEDGMGWWTSGIKKLDQTYTAPHHYKQKCEDRFVIADGEHEIEFPHTKGTEQIKEKLTRLTKQNNPGNREKPTPAKIRKSKETER